MSFHTQVFSYGFTNLHLGLPGATLSTWPDWPQNDRDISKSTTTPLDPSADGAMPFDDWKNIGEEFLLASNGELQQPKKSSGTLAGL